MISIYIIRTETTEHKLDTQKVATVLCGKGVFSTQEGLFIYTLLVGSFAKQLFLSTSTREVLSHELGNP